jgi:hypothetical protein
MCRAAARLGRARAGARFPAAASRLDEAGGGILAFAAFSREA